jgi:uncharacterized protein YjbJ (UPF0337 family)
LFGWQTFWYRALDDAPSHQQARNVVSSLVITARRYGKGSTMDENRVSGTAKNVGGKLEESFGRVTGDTKTQADGIAKQVSGTAQDVYGQARDAASEVAGTPRDTGASFEKLLRTTVEARPYTSASIALGIGWLLGRMHRPL